MLSLIVNGNEIGVPRETIKYTMQVNDIADLESRQCNYTDGFSIPKSRENVYIFNQLGLVGDVSDFPYQKIKVDLLDNGVHLIKDGWLDFQETAKEYKFSVRDGSIDLFKAIENKTFGDDIDLSEINHSKDLTTIINSFTNENYRYIVNDFGGKTHIDNGTKINIDYLVPSARVKYLWDKIFTTFGFNYTGNIFNHVDFTGLWLTYPKGITQEDATNTVEYARFELWNPQNLKYDSINVTTGNSTEYSYIVTEAGTYKIDYSGIFSFVIVDWAGQSYGNSGSVGVDLFVNGVITYGNSLFLNIGDVITIEFQNVNLGGGDSIGYILEETKQFTVLKYQNEINFSEELKKLKITDFFKEILWRFSLTIFIDEDGSYVFKTFDERLQAGVIDWSEKYKGRTSETYVPKKYAQLNRFKQDYRDDRLNHADGLFEVNNKNLEDEYTVIKSKIFSAEKDFVSFFINSTHSEILTPTLLWEKEVSENSGVQQIKYKELSGRFYFLRTQTISKTAILATEITGQQQSVTSLPIARFYMTAFKDFVPKYYNNISLLLNDFRMHKLLLNLNCVDINQMNFDKLYYFEQEQNYYFLNKLNYQSGKISNAEMVRVKYSESSNYGVDLIITGYENSNLYIQEVNAYNKFQIIIDLIGVQYISAIYGTPINGISLNSGQQIRLRDIDTLEIISNIFTIP